MIHYLTLELRTEEKQAVEALALRLDLTPMQVIRQAIRTYQYQIHMNDNPGTGLIKYDKASILRT